MFYAGDIDRAGNEREFHLVDERIVGRKPKTLDSPQAAALPLTSHYRLGTLFDRLKVTPGKTAISNAPDFGGAGGVGSIAIQLARALTNLTVIATASRPKRRNGPMISAPTMCSIIPSRWRIRSTR